jgi:GNAT superfamily N-acetyltransferase
MAIGAIGSFHFRARCGLVRIRLFPAGRTMATPAAHDNRDATERRASPAIAAGPVTGGAIELAFEDGVVLIRDANTTIGYCRHTADGDIEYIFVHPAHRRRGHGRRLLAEVERRTGRRGGPLPPISPLGLGLFGRAANAPLDSTDETTSSR